MAHYLVWKILPHLLGGGVRRLIAAVARTPLAMSFTLRLGFSEANRWVLLLWWDLSFKFLGNFRLIDLRFVCWGLFAGCGFSVLGKCFLY